MDEGLLNELLECSVCLERLDTSSRVLPCQHTFCLNCLKVIVESHKELRCPECRVLVEARLEELPPNVLLMRILEGMKNSTPARKQTPRSVHAQSQGSAQSAKHLPPHGRALFDYLSKEPGDLNFKKGDMIMLQKKLDPFWYQGECSGRTGMFPITYVQVVVPLPAPTALCKALYDFKMSAPDEEGCLAFDKGAIITVHRRVDENWAEGRLDQKVGIFPIAFVELNQPARHLINSAVLNRPVPPVPGHVRPPRPELRHHVRQNHQKYLQMSVSTPTTGQGNYINVSMMSQSHPNYQPMLAAHTLMLAQPSSQHSVTTSGLVTTTALPRTIMETTKHGLDLIQLNAPQTVQSTHRLDAKARTVKYESLNTTPIHRVETGQNANFTTNSSDSNSSINTPSVMSSTTPNISSISSGDSVEPSLPSSPNNNDSLPTPQSSAVESKLDASMAMLDLHTDSAANGASLNVTLPDSPKLEGAVEVKDTHESIEAPSTSLNPSGPNSLLDFGLGLQAALSMAKDGSCPAPRQHREKEKRHSLTPASMQGTHTTPNRHSAEILATSLLDHTPERERDRDRPARAERERRRERAPAAYVALYPYTPQKPDELELKKGAMYWVTERCRDGWYKGRAEGGRRAGVFPGNYVRPAPHQVMNAHGGIAKAQGGAAPAPDAPPRAPSPSVQPHQHHWSPQPHHQTTPRSEKVARDKTRGDKTSMSTGVSLMKRLAAMKKCKSPPPAGYSIDNPVFEDVPGTSVAVAAGAHAVHVRGGAIENPWPSQHRKCQSLDVTAAKRERHHAQPLNEKFRCVAPYPPSAEYELELKVDDIVIVSRKRGDGWYKGTLQRTGRTGLFPASFVQLCRE